MLILKQIKYLVGRYGILNWIPDSIYLKIIVSLKLHKFVNISNPKTFNEKLQWLKIHDRKPIYSTMVDKAEAKNYVASRVGYKYIIPTLGIWDSFDDIEFNELPNQFVLKTTHDSGGVVVCRDKKSFEKENAKRILENSLSINFYNYFREWPYKNVKPRIIAEEFLSALDIGDLIEYKIFCFNEKPQLILACLGEGHTANRTNDFYDIAFNHIPVSGVYKNATKTLDKPKVYDELLDIATHLAKGTYQVRVDLYVNHEKIYFGELTMFPDAGCLDFNPDRYDLVFGRMLRLPTENR